MIPPVPPAPAGSASTVPVTEARIRIADLVARTQHGGERIVLTKHGRAAAVLVPPADLDRLLALERATGLAVVESTTVGENSEVVWSTLVGRRSRDRWWPGVGLVDHVGAELVARQDPTGRGDVLAIVAERLLETTWQEDGWPTATRLRIELAEAVGTTTVRVVHTGWEQLPDGDALAQRYRGHWRERLDAWRTVLTPVDEG